MTAQQLKASILQLAIQGKLVPQNPADEPASVLLKKIKAEKDALVKAGKLKKGKPLPPISEDEIPFDIPESWEWVRLGNLLSILNGDRGKNYPAKSKLQQCGDIPFVSAINMNGGNIVSDNLLFVSQTQFDALRAGKFYPGDILLCIRGSLGKYAVVKGYSGAIASSLVILRIYALSLMVIEMIQIWIESPLFADEIKKYNNGTAQPNLAAADLERFLFPLPPLEEQKRIVAKIEELLPHVEEYGKAETALSKLNAELPEQLKKSILQWAIQGRLVPQDPTDEPASERLKRIKAEKSALIKSGKIKKEKPLPPISEDEIPFDIPDSWEWIRLGSLFHISPRNDVDDDVDVGFMPMPLLQEGFRNSHSFEVRKWRQVKNGFTHFMNGDIVIAKITPCFQNRKSAIISNLPNEYGAGTTELHVLRDETHLLCLRYFLWIFKTHAFIESGVKHFTGTAGQQRIGKDFLSNYLVPLPPLAEQKRIVEKVEKLMSTLFSL
ncbi:MAG: restriction endonuclease subunit S [Lentisphaeria bacterium]|nr:restriction endonuclease subunit S [Lentisphaeria bacterium]